MVLSIETSTAYNALLTKLTSDNKSYQTKRHTRNSILTNLFTKGLCLWNYFTVSCHFFEAFFFSTSRIPPNWKRTTLTDSSFASHLVSLRGFVVLLKNSEHIPSFHRRWKDGVQSLKSTKKCSTLYWMRLRHITKGSGCGYSRGWTEPLDSSVVLMLGYSCLFPSYWIHFYNFAPNNTWPNPNSKTIQNPVRVHCCVLHSNEPYKKVVNSGLLLLIWMNIPNDNWGLLLLQNIRCAVQFHCRVLRCFDPVIESKNSFWVHKYPVFLFLRQPF